jgi:UDP:flavonoid glycosyltransferase YjiC (YdhE family)
MSNPLPLLLIFPFDAMAHYLRCLSLADTLSDRFQIQFLYSHKYHRFVENAGYETFSCAALDGDQVMQAMRKFDFSWLEEGTLTNVFLSQVDKIHEVGPVAVLGDTMPTLKMAAEAAGIPYVSLMNGYTSKYYASGRSMPREHPMYKMVSLLPENFSRLLISAGEQKYFREMHKPFRSIRNRFGLSHFKSYFSEMEGDLNLICDLPELFPQQHLPSNYHFIEPLFYQGEKAVLPALQKLDLNKKTIFITMGSTGDWSRLAMLNDEKFARFNVVTACDKENVLHAPHILSLDFVDINTCLVHADLVICHGGNGTIYQALRRGLPLLCRTSHCEQEWNVQMLIRKGLGASIDDVSTVSQLLGILDRWIDAKQKPVFKSVSERLSTSVSRFDLFTELLPLISQKNSSRLSA